MSLTWSQIAPRCGRARLAVEVALWRHGAAWGLALALAAVAAVVWGLAVRPAAAKADALAAALKGVQAEQTARTSQQAQRRAGALGASGASGAPEAITPASLPPSPQEALAAVLRPRSASGEVIQRIYRLAEQQQVTVLQADFQQASAAAGVMRLTMRLPVTASYPQLRDFVEAVLRGLPNVSLDSMSFKRGQVAQAQVDAQLQLSIWLTTSGPSLQDAVIPPQPLRGP